MAAGDATEAAGWDGLSTESIGSGPDLDFLEELAFGGTVVVTDDPPALPNPFTTRFAPKVKNYADYGDAIAAKIARVVNPVPIPAALPLLMGGIGLLGFVGRRRKAAAA